MNKLAFVGPLPPPVTGRIVASDHMLKLLHEQFNVVEVSNIAPGESKGFASRYLLRAARLAQAFMGVVRGRHRGATCLFVVVDGNLGMYHTALLAGLARAYGFQLVLQHHNWSPFAEATLRMRVLTIAAGKSALHVISCGRMAQLGHATYSRFSHWHVVSNGLLTADQSAASPNKHARQGRTAVHLGHMSNLTQDKGLHRVLDAFEQCRAEGRDVFLHLAGPIFAANDRQRVEAFSTRYKHHFRYWGGVYGATKQDFFASVDLFLFPSTYANEVAPLVTLEALSAGCPLVVFPTGCCEEMVCDESGWILEPDLDFSAGVSRIVSRISKMSASGRDALAASARARYQVLVAMAREETQTLFARIADGWAGQKNV